MPSVLETLLALNGGNLPPLPGPASGLPLGLPNVPLVPAPAPPITGGPPPAMPQAAPVAPAPAFNQGLVNQYLQFLPPPPTPPPAPSRLQQVAGVLGGIGAGLQGRGPEFAYQLQEPQRRYQQQVENYNQQRG